MKIFVGLLFLILGFLFISILIFKETNRETLWKIVMAGVCGALVLGGLIIICV